MSSDYRANSVIREVVLYQREAGSVVLALPSPNGGMLRGISHCGCNACYTHAISNVTIEFARVLGIFSLIIAALPFTCLQTNQPQQDPQLLKVINLTAIAIRRLIKMSKKISAFKNMCQEDQLALLKGGCTEMMILRSAMQYDCDRATWKVSLRWLN